VILTSNTTPQRRRAESAMFFVPALEFTLSLLEGFQTSDSMRSAPF
jgi:hypothetical protein